MKYQGKAYAMTQMEPISARYAFPGFDEPAFKTPFNLSLTVPSHDQALANTIAISTKPAGKGWKTVTFAPTVPLPTYLVAYAAGPWDVVDVAPMPATRSAPTPRRCAALPPRARARASRLHWTKPRPSSPRWRTTTRSAIRSTSSIWSPHRTSAPARWKTQGL